MPDARRLPQPSSYPPAGDAGDTGASGTPWASEGLPCAFGEYVLLRRRATGGMAELFIATRRGPGGGELVVIKRVPTSLTDASDRAALGRLLVQEGRTMAVLAHTNVARLLDSGSVDGDPYIVLERVHGEDLRAIVRQMRKKRVAEFPIESALGIVLGVCEGLAHVHERCSASGEPLGIVHRDVSPQNVLVTFAGEVKLVDFGVAESALAGDARAGRPKGKLAYMSPEQARGEALDGRSDVFATGVLLFELTTGQRLFKGAGDRETRALLLERPYPRPSHVFAPYPRALEVIVERALAKDREQRWSSARELGAALEAFVRDEGVDVGPTVLARMMTSLFELEMVEEAAALAQAQRVAFCESLLL